MADLLDNIPDDLDSITAIKVNFDQNSQVRKKFEALRQDMKDASHNRKIGNKATVVYAVNKAYDALQAEENLYEQIEKTKARHIQ